MLKIFIISLMGMGVVFGFLFFVYIILTLFKYIFKDKDIEKEIDTYNTIRNNNITEEELAVIMTGINHYCAGNLKNKQIIIRKLEAST